MFFKIITIGNPGKKDPLEKDTLMLAIYTAFREAFSDLPAYAPPERKQGELMLMGLKDGAEKLARKDLFCYSLAPVYEATLKVYQALEQQSRPFRELSSSVLKAQVNATQHDAHYAMLLPPLSPQAHYPDAREFFNRHVVAPGKRHFSDADLIPIVTELEKMLPPDFRTF
jgi:hypothetical protein